MSGLSHTEVVAGIAAVASRVMMVALPVQATMPLSHEDAAKELQQDVIEVLRLQKFPPVYIDQHANWSELLKQGSERDRLIFIALVLGIYE